MYYIYFSVENISVVLYYIYITCIDFIYTHLRLNVETNGRSIFDLRSIIPTIDYSWPGNWLSFDIYVDIITMHIPLQKINWNFTLVTSTLQRCTKEYNHILMITIIYQFVKRVFLFITKLFYSNKNYSYRQTRIQ